MGTCGRSSIRITAPPPQTPIPHANDKHIRAATTPRAPRTARNDKPVEIGGQQLLARAHFPRRDPFELRKALDMVAERALQRQHSNRHASRPGLAHRRRRCCRSVCGRGRGRGCGRTHTGAQHSKGPQHPTRMRTHTPMQTPTCRKHRMQPIHGAASGKWWHACHFLCACMRARQWVCERVLTATEHVPHGACSDTAVGRPGARTGAIGPWEECRDPLR